MHCYFRAEIHKKNIDKKPVHGIYLYYPIQTAAILYAVFDSSKKMPHERKVYMKRKIIFSFLLSMMLTAAVSCGNENKSSKKDSSETSSSDSTETGTTTTAPAESTTEQTTTEAPTEIATEAPTEAPTEKTDYNKVYSDIISDFRNVITNGLQDDTEILGDPTVIYSLSGREAEYNLGYAIEDLSGDGIPELTIATIDEKRDGIGYGNLVYAVYTCHDDTVSLAFEGSYRNSYSYKGDGTFFYRGSSGAMYSIFGSFTLQPDGRKLSCNDYYFTYPKDDTYTEIGCYHNTLGIVDKEQSEELDITEDEFWEMNKSMDTESVEIALTPFVDEYENKASSKLFAEYIEDSTYNEDSCNYYSIDNSDSSTKIVFSTDGKLQDFKLLSLFMEDVSDDGKVSYSVSDIYSYGTLTFDAPLLVELTFYGDTPSYGVSYTDETGETKRFSISMSGYDGSLELLEF